MDARTAEVRRVLDRYLIEVVEKYELCPWAKPARLGDEVAIEVLWGIPTIDAWSEAARALLARPKTRVAMVLAPEIEAPPAELRVIRNRVNSRLPGVGIAEFHPDGITDTATAARLVPFLRRSPDPLLQLVPLSLLESVRGAPQIVDVMEQAQILSGQMAPPRGDVADELAEQNHARVTARMAEVEGVLASIAEDRRTSYARVGITVGTGRSR
ncbi:MAG TPA: hypothetical protein VMZ53_10780 [Kofleriaceae bacterium]|nr:hypothetical protein [Kofleriaceae bacterium]